MYATIENSYADANVHGTSADSRVGGIAGENAGAMISNSYALGSVTGTRYVGGVSGTNRSTKEYRKESNGTTIQPPTVKRLHLGVIENSYAANSVSGTSDAGGITGYNFPSAFLAQETRSPELENEQSPKVVSSFYDTQATGQSDSGKGTGMSTADMQQKRTFTGWDFTNIWTMPAGDYPHLR